jgi:hypothetical protein
MNLLPIHQHTTTIAGDLTSRFSLRTHLIWRSEHVRKLRSHMLGFELPPIDHIDTARIGLTRDPCLPGFLLGKESFSFRLATSLGKRVPIRIYPCIRRSSIHVHASLSLGSCQFFPVVLMRDGGSKHGGKCKERCRQG